MAENPNADTKRRKEIMRELELDLLATIKRHAVRLCGVADDVPNLYTSIMQAVFIAVLTVQAETNTDKTITVGQHMKAQYEFGRSAYRKLANANVSRWGEPATLEPAK